MNGIKYIVDEKGRKSAVVIDLKKFGDFWEDLYDYLLCLTRKDEPTFPLSEVKADLKKLGKLRGKV